MLASPNDCEDENAEYERFDDGNPGNKFHFLQALKNPLQKEGNAKDTERIEHQKILEIFVCYRSRKCKDDQQSGHGHEQSQIKNSGECFGNFFRLARNFARSPGAGSKIYE